jgi:hypothetical protein
LQIQPYIQSPGIHDGTRESACKKISGAEGGIFTNLLGEGSPPDGGAFLANTRTKEKASPIF